MIRVQNLVKEYGNGDLIQRVLKDITLSIDSGEFVSIIGPSGAGKSTLMYQMSLLDQPTNGDVFIDDRRMRDLDEQAKTRLRLMELGYVFQDYALLPELTALENVLLPMYMQGLNRRAATEKAETALSRVGLLDRQHSVPSKLSGGQQQRVSIARAIAHSPKILFADEPTANLDSENSQLVMESFIDIYKSGQTIIMVTHEMEYARMAKRTIELRDGRVVTDVKN